MEMSESFVTHTDQTDTVDTELTQLTRLIKQNSIQMSESHTHTDQTDTVDTIDFPICRPATTHRLSLSLLEKWVGAHLIDCGLLLIEGSGIGHQ